jgi:hypothetical protein
VVVGECKQQPQPQPHQRGGRPRTKGRLFRRLANGTIVEELGEQANANASGTGGTSSASNGTTLAAGKSSKSTGSTHKNQKNPKQGFSRKGIQQQKKVPAADTSGRAQSRRD